MIAMDQISKFAEQLRNTALVTRVELSTFPSGAINLDIHYAGKLYVMAYFPTDLKFCVDEARPEDGIGSDFRYAFGEFAEAKEQILAMLGIPHLKT